MGQDGAKMGPRWAKMGPRWGQDGPRRGQDGSKMGQHRPKMGPGGTPRCRQGHIVKNNKNPRVFGVVGLGTQSFFCIAQVCEAERKPPKWMPRPAGARRPWPDLQKFCLANVLRTPMACVFSTSNCHESVKKSSERKVLCGFWLRNVVPTTMACVYWHHKFQKWLLPAFLFTFSRINLLRATTTSFFGHQRAIQPPKKPA